MYGSAPVHHLLVFECRLDAFDFDSEQCLGADEVDFGEELIRLENGRNLGAYLCGKLRKDTDDFSALFAFQLAKRHSTPAYTYGYKKGTVLISLVNAIILLVAVGAIIVESIRKFSHPVPVDGAAVSWTAGVGILVNGLTAWWLMRGQKNDLNVRGAFLHMVADTVVSVGVVVAGVVISLTGWTIVDPLLSLAIAVVILASTWKLLSESLRLSLDGTPEGIDLDEVLRLLESAPHVAGVHHLHVWALSTTETALTAHVVVDDWSLAEAAREQIKERLKAMGIGHSTLELESRRTRCHSTCCD